jgi:hypothetical protein
MPRDELLDPQPTAVDLHLGVAEEGGLRPKTMDDFVGQAELKERLCFFLFDLFDGPLCDITIEVVHLHKIINRVFG